jgi:hypothetical protein
VKTRQRWHQLKITISSETCQNESHLNKCIMGSLNKIVAKSVHIHDIFSFRKVQENEVALEMNGTHQLWDGSINTIKENTEKLLG